MAEGFHDWASGEEVTEANLGDYTTLQSIMRFASSAARATALSAVLTEGLASFLKDANTIGIYSGSAWSTIGPVHGAHTAVTPVITQGVTTPTFTNLHCAYTRFGRLIVGSALLSLTSSGSASNGIVVSGFPTAAANVDVIGNGYIIDATGPVSYSVRPYFATTSTVQFHRIDTTGTPVALSTLIMGTGANAMTAALASGDGISFNFMYEAASDA